MKTEITSEEYWTLVACQSGLGYEGATAEGLEELTRRTTKAYWDGQDVRPACPECESGERTADEVRDKLRIHAFHSLYLSGTKYALETLQNGEGFPEDLLEPVVLEEAIKFVEACMRGERPEIYEEP